MSNCQHTALHTIQYATSYWPSHTTTQYDQLPTHSSTYNSVRHFLLTPPHPHIMSNCQQTAVHFISVLYFQLNPSHSHTKCPTTNTHQYTQFSTQHPAYPLTLPHKMPNYQHTAVHTIQYATSCWLPHTPTQNVQLPTHSSTYNSVRHFLLTPSHSHTKCPTTNTQGYIQFSTPLPADPLTLPHKMFNSQHTAVHLISYSLTAMCW